ncbi:MAG: GIY-YIG nuclease family protein [Treponema sp.]|jgi:hypothetical protein|nr:GIY-YIG nuclease family protein [Treponema sp.]
MNKILAVKDTNYTFEKVDLRFSENMYKDIFMEKNNKTLLETIKSKRYRHLEQEVYEKYSNCLNMKLGLFLKKLKTNKNIFYKKFLNNYGDLIYSIFKIDDTKTLLKKGLYIYCINNELKYIGRSKDPFGKRINNGYGKISPKNCYLDGQSTNCHINSLITKNRNNVQLFVLEINNDEMIESIEKDLIKKYKPEWNIQI